MGNKSIVNQAGLKNLSKERGLYNMKRSLLIVVLVLILSLSFAVQAKNETMLEGVWDNYLTTTELENSADEGKVNLNLLSKKYDDDAQLFGYFLDGGYGFDGFDVVGYLGGLSYDGFNNDSTDLYFGGSVKAELYDQDDFLVAAQASAEWDQEMTYGLGFYTDKMMDENLSLHNNLLFVIDEAAITKRLFNGVDYRLNEQHALKAYLYTELTDLDSMTNAINLMYKNDFNDQVKFISSFQKTLRKDNIQLKNLVEVKPMTDLVVTGYYGFNTHKNDELGIDVRKDFADFSVTGGYNYSTNRDTLYGSLTYDLREDMELGFEFEREEEDGYVDYTLLKTGVSYSL